jgi:hypothetical protein
LTRDPLVVAVELRRVIEYSELATGQDALAAELVSLLRVARRSDAAGRAARRRANRLAEAEILAELEDRAGGEAAVLRHIARLRQLLGTTGPETP